MSIERDDIEAAMRERVQESPSPQDTLDNLRLAFETVWAENVVDDEFEVTLSNTFEARSFEDAVGQMATYASDQAYQAGYRVTNVRSGESRFVDADNVDWDALSEENL